MVTLLPITNLILVIVRIYVIYKLSFGVYGVLLEANYVILCSRNGAACSQHCDLPPGNRDHYLSCSFSYLCRSIFCNSYPYYLVQTLVQDYGWTGGSVVLTNPDPHLICLLPDLLSSSKAIRAVLVAVFYLSCTSILSHLLISEAVFAIDSESVLISILTLVLQAYGPWKRKGIASPAHPF